MNFLDNWMKRHDESHAKFLAKYGPDYEKPVGHGFCLNRAEQGAVDEWAASLRAEIIAIQKSGSKGTDLEGILTDEPYYGATGGGLSYSFTPTSLGTICVVTEAITKKTLNVADATDWFFYG